MRLSKYSLPTIDIFPSIIDALSYVEELLFFSIELNLVSSANHTLSIRSNSFVSYFFVPV